MCVVNSWFASVYTSPLVFLGDVGSGGRHDFQEDVGHRCVILMNTMYTFWGTKIGKIFGKSSFFSVKCLRDGGIVVFLQRESTSQTDGEHSTHPDACFSSIKD